LDREFFTSAVEAKRLKGTNTQDGFFSNVTIDETPESLCKFIEEHGAECFSHEEPLVVRRINSK
jgi:hypothetical protein